MKVGRARVARLVRLQKQRTAAEPPLRALRISSLAEVSRSKGASLSELI